MENTLGERRIFSSGVKVGRAVSRIIIIVGNVNPMEIHYRETILFFVFEIDYEHVLAELRLFIITTTVVVELQSYERP